MFKKLSIRSKMIAGFSIPVLMAVIIVFSLLTSLKNANFQFEDFIKYTYKAHSTVQETQIEILTISRYLSDMVLTSNSQKKDEYVENINTHMENVKQDLITLNELYQGGDDLIKNYTNLTNEWLEIAKEITNLVNVNDYEAAKDLIFTKSPDKLNSVEVVAASVIEYCTTKVTTTSKNAIRESNLDMLINLIIIIGVIIFSIFVGYSTITSVMVPIRSLRELAVKVYDGDFSAKLEYHSENEFGKLAKDMEKTIYRWISYMKEVSYILAEISNGNLRNIVKNEYVGDFREIENSLNTIINSLNKTIFEISKSSIELSNNSEQVAKESLILANGAEQQAASIEQIFSTIIEISNRLEANLMNSENATNASNSATSEVRIGNTQMEALVKAMKEINKSSDEISIIIKVIDDLAFQTNLLSLNAAIEAARAGEAGQGFAVVAGEVKSLAEKSSEASKNITELINNSINAVKKGMIMANETAHTLEVIVSDAKKASELTNIIAETTKQQSASISQLKLGIEQVSSVVQENSASSEESAAAAEELNKQAQKLDKMVKKFELKEFLNHKDS